MLFARFFLLALLTFTSVCYSKETVFAGVSFVGDYDQQTVRYPYAAKLLKEKLPNGQARLESELKQVLDEIYQVPLVLTDSSSGRNGGLTGTEFTVATEEIEQINWAQGYLYIYRVLASVLIFDFEKKPTGCQLSCFSPISR